MKYLAVLLLLLCGSAWATATTQTTTTEPVINNTANFTAYQNIPFIKLSYLVQTNNANANSMNMGASGYPSTNYGQQMIGSIGTGGAQYRFNNNSQYVSIPWTGQYWIIFDAWTANLNGGSGEHNSITGNVFNYVSGGGNTNLCSMNIYQPGGGGHSGSGFTYYNTTACGPMQLTKGQKLGVWFGVTDSGTGDNANVGLISSTVSIQTFQDW